MKWSYERANERKVTVEGAEFTVYDNYKVRGTYAEDGTGMAKRISGGYVSNERTVRKAIAAAFGIHTFRK